MDPLFFPPHRLPRYRIHVWRARTQRHLLGLGREEDVSQAMPVSVVLAAGKKLGHLYCLVQVSVCGSTYFMTGACVGACVCVCEPGLACPSMLALPSARLAPIACLCACARREHCGHA